MLDKLRRSAQAIAQPAAVQIRLFPDFVMVADELALGWEEAIQDFHVMRPHLQPLQIAAIEELDAFMVSISGKSNAQLWTIDAVNASPEWQIMREMANRILDRMCWPKVPPSSPDEIYVSFSR